MNSKLTTILGIGLFMAVVFGATILSQFNLSDDPAKTAGPDEFPAQPLDFALTDMFYDPAGDQPARRFFPGFYETGPAENPATYWFRNPNAVPAALAVLDRSCTSCSSARVSLPPPAAVADLLANRATVDGKTVVFPPVGLPLGGLPVPDLAAALAAAPLLRQMKWHEFDLDKKKGDAVEVPAAALDGTPTWGVLQLGVKVSGVGPKTLHATVGLYNPGRPDPVKVDFKVTMVGVTPFAVTPDEIDVGPVAATAGPRTRDVVYWSATRPQAAFPPPKVGLGADDPLLAAGDAVPLSAEERVGLEGVFRAGKHPAPVTAAYRFPLTLLPARPAGAATPDIGPFERVVGIAGPDGSNARLTVKGSVTGTVELAGGHDLKLGRFNGQHGTTKTVQLVTDAAGLELEPLPAEFRPEYLRATLDAPRSEGGRRFWALRVTVPPESGYGDLPPDAAVVLRVKGPNGPRVRLPVQGTAGLR